MNDDRRVFFEFEITIIQAFSIIALFCGASVYAYAISTAINIFINMDRDSNEYRRIMNDVKGFLEVHRLPQGLQIRVRQYFGQLYRYKSSRRMREEQLMRKMSPELRGLCARHMHEKWFNSLPFLGALTNNLLAEMFLALRLQTFIPREKIFEVGDISDALFIIRRGAVFVRGKLYAQGNCFGEEMIFSRLGKREYGAQALQFVETYVLDRNAFYDVLDGHPDIIKTVRKGAIKMTFRRRIVQILAKMTVERNARKFLNTFPKGSAPHLHRSSSHSVAESYTMLYNSETLEKLGTAPTNDNSAALQTVLQYLVHEVADLRKLLRDIAHKDSQSSAS